MQTNITNEKVCCATCGKVFSEKQILKANRQHRELKYCSSLCWGRRKREYLYNDKFLNIITPFSAYFLGFYSADGHRSRDGGVCLSSSDLELINQFVEKTNYKGSIGGRKRPNHPNVNAEYRLAFYGDISKRMEEIGYSPGPKTGKEFIPSCITKEIFPHYLRGVIDGDGTAHLEKDHGYLHYGICCANYKFLEDIHKRLTEYGIVKGGFLREDHSPHRTIPFFDLGYAHQDSIAIGDYIYKDADIMLHRKYENYLIGKKYEIQAFSQKGITCSIPNCSEPADAKNLCKIHYDQQYGKKYFQEHKEEVYEYQRKWKEENREKYLEQRHNNYQNNQEREIQRQSTWRKENPEKVRETKRKHRETHRDEINQYKKEYRKRDPERQKELDHAKYERNKEKSLKKNKEYYEKNKAKKLEYAKKYREEHKEKLKEYFKQHYQEKKDTENPPNSTDSSAL